MRSDESTGSVGNDPGWPLGVSIPAGDPVEEILQYHVAYPNGSTGPLPQVQTERAVSLLVSTTSEQAEKLVRQ